MIRFGNQNNSQPIRSQSQFSKQKKPIEEAVFIENHGIEGDAHAGEWHRQVSLLASESISKVQKKTAKKESTRRMLL